MSFNSSEIEAIIKYTFKNNREGFDFATNALKNLLKKHGYERNGNNEWIK